MQRQLIRQKGAALIVVLSLLSISLMVGLSSMQSSQIDERLAGNYKAATEAQMAAESGASKLGASDKKASAGDCLDLIEGHEEVVEWESVDLPNHPDQISAWYVTCESESSGSYFIVQGRVEAASAVSMVVVSVGHGGLGDDEDLNDFIEWLEDSLVDLGGEAECDFGELGDAPIYFCDGGFYGDGPGNSKPSISNDLGGVVLVSTGEMDFSIENNSDVEGVVLVSLGDITVSGVGSNSVIEGEFWSGGSVKINGGGNQDFNISVCAPGEATVNGGSLADDQGCSWIGDFVSDLNYPGGGGREWRQL